MATYIRLENDNVVYEIEPNDPVTMGPNLPNKRKFMSMIAKTLPSENVSGDSASFSDDIGGMPIKNIVVDIDPVQSGTGDPSPENVRPISVWTGVNLTRAGFNLFDVDGASIVAGNYAGSGTSINAHTETHIRVSPNTTYYYRSDFTVSGIYINAYDANKAYISEFISKYSGTDGFTFTTPDNCQYIRIMWYRSSDIAVSEVKNGRICINLSDPAKNGTYEPYKGSTYTITFPDEAGTVYGGSLTINQDGSADLNSDWKEYKCYEVGGSTGWVIGSSGQATGGYYWASLSRGVTPAYEVNTPADGSDYGLFNYGKWRYGAETGQWRAYIASNRTNASIVITSDSEISTESAVNDFLATLPEPLQICYKLQTPVVYHLRSIDQITTLAGQNNIWADTGAVSVDYREDTQTYIDDRIERIELMITTNRETGMTATKAYTAGDLIVINDTLYKALTNIANGASCTVGTNIQATTIEAELDALA